MRAFFPSPQHELPARFNDIYGDGAFHQFVVPSAKMVYMKYTDQIKKRDAQTVLDSFNNPQRLNKLAGKDIAEDLAYTLEQIRKKIADQVNHIFTNSTKYNSILTRCVSS